MLSAVLRHSDDWSRLNGSTDCGRIAGGRRWGGQLDDGSGFGAFVPVNAVVRFEAAAHLMTNVWLHLADVHVGSGEKEKKKKIKNFSWTQEAVKRGHLGAGCQSSGIRLHRFSRANGEERRSCAPG